MILADIQNLIIHWLRDWTLLAPTLYILIRIITTIVPFIPGIAVNTAGIFLFGWFVTFVYVTVGTVIGGVIIFLAMRYFRDPLARRFKGLEQFDSYTALLSGKREFWSLFFLRIPASLTFDYLSYGAGLSKVGFPKFLTSMILVEILINFPMIYFSDMAIHSGWIAFVLIIISLVAAYLILRRVNWRSLASRGFSNKVNGEEI